MREVEVGGRGGETSRRSELVGLPASGSLAKRRGVKVRKEAESSGN